MRLNHTSTKATRLRPPQHVQRGVTLIELLVGLSIGLMVIAVAMGALMVSRGVSGTVSDASTIQQQAAYAMRVIGQQIRQAGSLYLNPDPVGGAMANPLNPVIFETDAQDTGSTPISFSQAETIGATSATEVTSTFRRYLDAVYVSPNPTSLVRNCLGGPEDSAVNATQQAVVSAFALHPATATLRCTGNGVGPQPIVQNVADFQVRYMLQLPIATGTAVRYLTYDEMALLAPDAWRSVQGVEVCLVLYGAEAIDMPAPANAADPQGTYVGCDGTRVDMTSLASPRTRRMHMVFRNVFQLRSQGLLRVDS